MSDVRLCAAVAVAGIAATGVFVEAPFGSVLQVAAWLVPFVLATVLLAVRVKAGPADVRGPLRLLLAGALVYGAASVVWFIAPVRFGAVLPFPSLLDGLYFTSYALYALFLLAALRRRVQDRGLASRLAVADAMILTLAMTSVLWLWVVEPNLTNGTPVLPTAVAVLYPAVQLALFALAARLLLSLGGASRGAAALLCLWITGELAAAVFYGVQSANGTFRYNGPLVPVWMLAYTALAAFAVHPGLRTLLQPAALPASAAPAAHARMSRCVQRRLRMGALLGAALVPLALAAFTQEQDIPLMAVAAVTFALGLYRAAVLAGDLDEQQRLGAELEEALTQLRAQHHELARLAVVVVDSTSDAVVTCSREGVVLSWNRGAERLYGYTSEEAVGRKFSTFLPVEDRQDFEVNAALAVEQVHHAVERKIVCKDGSTVEVETVLSVFYDDAGETVVGISRDVTERNRLQRELTAHARRLDEAQRVAGLGSWEWDLRTDAVVWSAELYRLFRLDEGTPVSPALFLQHVHPDDRSRVEQTIHLAEAVMEFVMRIVRGDGEVRWIAVRGELVHDADDVPVRKTGTAQDITERHQLQHELATRVRQLDEAQRLAGVGSFGQDLTTGRDVWSAEFYRIFDLDKTGCAPSYATVLDRIHSEDRAAVERHNRTAGPDRPMDYETRIVRGDGEVRWLHVHAEVLPDRDGVGLRVSGTVHDITERKLAEAELERLALTDALTGLANRVRFTSVLQSALDRPTGTSVGLLLLDLDGFKDVNDGIGHHAGDVVLQEVARRVTGVLRGQEHVARLGGDEFAVVLPDVAGVDGAVAVAARVRSCLERAFDLDGITVHVSGSIGIAVSAGTMDTGRLLKQADVAMYRAKTLSCGWAVFEPDQDDVAAGRLQMVTELRSTIERGDLDVAYQPVLDTRTRRVSAFEALARWHHPQKGTIQPDQFIPLAEQADLIVPLTRLVLRKAATACARWRSAGHDLRVAVNLSVQVMQSVDARALVADVLDEVGLAPHHLVLEITEGSLATEAGGVRPTLDALHELGVMLAIDDFGTGYSAMSYLKELPVEGLKIDRSFVRDITSDTRDLAIVRSLVRLAHSLSLRVVAEGVESEPALEVLTALGCDFAQGYGIARPMPEDETVGWLARYHAPSAARVGRHHPTDLLVVDDSAVVRAHLTSLASQAGWQVRVAASAEEALLEVERAVPDVVILDQNMTGMTGMASVPELRARGVDGPILLFTRFLSDAVPSQRMPLDVWPVSKNNPDAVLELLEGYRTSARQAPTR